MLHIKFSSSIAASTTVELACKFERSSALLPHVYFIFENGVVDDVKIHTSSNSKNFLPESEVVPRKLSQVLHGKTTKGALRKLGLERVDRVELIVLDTSIVHVTLFELSRQFKLPLFALFCPAAANVNPIKVALFPLHLLQSKVNCSSNLEGEPARKKMLKNY